MNPAFFNLPQPKQRNLLGAGYQAFALLPYGKASMAAIAAKAGVSKGLLFYYFQNKREFYLYLFAQALEFMKDERMQSSPDNRLDLFVWVRETVRRRLSMLTYYPFLMRFATRAYYETDPAVQPAIAHKKRALLGLGVRDVLAHIDITPFTDPADAEALLSIILNVAEGCMRGQEVLDAMRLNAVVAGFDQMMDSLQRHYYRPEAWKENQA